MASGVRDDVSHEYTCFIRRGEDEHLHGRFLSALGMINVRGQILSVLDLKKFFDAPMYRRPPSERPSDGCASVLFYTLAAYAPHRQGQLPFMAS
jgi:hypothetical protein